jgi:hypothetical protein
MENKGNGRLPKFKIPFDRYGKLIITELLELYGMANTKTTKITGRRLLVLPVRRHHPEMTGHFTLKGKY